MSPKRTKRVNVPLTESEKERWDGVTGEGERFSSLAELARTSVHRELEGYHDKSTESGADGAGNGALADSIEQMAGTLSSLESTVNGLETRFDRFEEQVTAEGPEMDLDNVIFDLLPVNPEAGEGITAHQLTDRYGFDLDEATNSLDRLSSRTATVETHQPPAKVVGISDDEDAEPPIYYYRTDDEGRR